MPIWSTWSRPAQPAAQAAIASRAALDRSVAAAIAEVGAAQACLALLENPGADVPSFSLDRMVERFGHLAPIREALLARDDLAMATRQAVLSKLSQTLAGFVAARQWLGPEHAEYATREACEKATVALAADTPYEEVGELIAHLRTSGQLTAGMILRALLSGNVVLFEEALAELSGLPIERVTGYIHDKTIAALPRALRQGRAAGVRLSGVPRGDRGHARGRADRRAGRGGAAQAPHGRARARRLRRRRRARDRPRCWRCCGALRSRPRARKRACSATTWSRRNGCRRRTPLPPIVLDERLVA